MPAPDARPPMKKQTSTLDSAPTPYRSEKFSTAAESITTTEEPLSSALSFSGEQVLFISSSDELHAHLLPHLKSWGLATTACHHPTAIRQDRLQKFQVVVLCGSKTSWNPKDENRLVAGAASIIECEADHPLQPKVINARIIEVSWRSLQGLFDALQLAVQPRPANSGRISSTDDVAHFQQIPAPIRTAFLESARSSLAIIKSSKNRKDVQRELHNLSGSLRFFDLTELSIRCAGLENGINHDGLMHHAHSLLALELQLDQLLEEIRTLNGR
ncbi:Hpt domain-containing protein [Delftia acidovorans]|nr:Hpt domain-containing protein [Delftia acidovorans]